MVKPADYLRLLLLAAIWGAAFIFMRVTAPVLGAVWTAELRVLLGGLALLAWFRWKGFDPGLRQHAASYLLVGGIGIAAPFLLYAFAAIHAPASLLAIINASSPMFGLAWGAILDHERIDLRKGIGLLAGVGGVALVVGPTPAGAGPGFVWAVAAGLAASCLYGVVGVLIRRFAAGVPPRGMAAGNQIAAALVLLPLLPLAPPLAAPSTLVVINVLALALVASGVAFLLYFRLIADVGATRALTVTYLIPLFGILWGRLLLGEAPPAAALVGALLILTGTALVTHA